MFKLYLIVGQADCKQHNIEDVVTKAIQGGVDAVQLREKNASTEEILHIGKKLQVILHKYNLPLIINDRVDIALALDVDGVHLGQTDMPYDVARKLLGPDKIIGLTVANQEQAKIAEALDADYLGVGPIFPTQFKKKLAPLLGIPGLEKIRKISKHHICAIAGINPANAGSVLSAGADGIAVVSAICAAQDPKSVSQKLRNIINNAK